MKAVILAGGYGTRLSEETSSRPKPMVEIGGRPILWHIMKIFEKHGITDFIVCCGYKGYFIKEYFANYWEHNSDIRVSLKDQKITTLKRPLEDWNVTLVDTGDGTMTGGRLKRVIEHLSEDEPFIMTYGDGVADINISELLDFHKRSGKLATVTAVIPPGRFGALEIDNDGGVIEFIEKPVGDGNLINGGFFVLEKEALKGISSDSTVWEKEPLETLALRGELAAYRHNGFWQPMDTLRDKEMLNSIIKRGQAPWL